MSFRIVRLAGFQVTVHYSWIFIFMLIILILTTGYMPHHYPGLTAVSYWTIGLTAAGLLFISVLFHELCHSIVARRYGLPIARINLFFFGGVAEMTEEPKDPKVELKMAAAGPASSILLAIIFGSATYVSTTLKAIPEIFAPLNYGFIINLFLAGFNLLPGFPMDGGRILRAAVWMWTRDIVKATRIATSVGIGLAYAMVGLGFLVAFTGSWINGLWIVFIGLFIKGGAESSLRHTIINRALLGVAVGDIMTREVKTVSPDLTVDNFVTEYLLKFRHEVYPVLIDGRILGVVSIQDAKQVPKDQWRSTYIKDIMRPHNMIVAVRPDQEAVEALMKMSKYEVGQLLVIDDEHLLGIVTHSDILHMVKARTELSL
ncbi:MAG: site-2 protease family protein [Candidatus Bathyarchaeia archaeon]